MRASTCTNVTQEGGNLAPVKVHTQSIDRMDVPKVLLEVADGDDDVMIFLLLTFGIFRLM